MFFRIGRIRIADERARQPVLAFWRATVDASGVSFGAAAISELPSCTNGKIYCSCRASSVDTKFISSMN